MCTPAHACVHVICRHEQRDALLHEAEAGKEMGHAYAQKAAAVAEAVSTSDLRSTLLEDQCKLLAQAVRDEERERPQHEHGGRMYWLFPLISSMCV